MSEAAPSKELLRFDRLSVGYAPRRAIVSDVSVSVEAGSALGVVGPNGCGKTTLLKTLVGVLRPVGGAIRWNNGSRAGGRVGYVPQRDAIDPIYPFEALEVVLLALGTGRVFAPMPGAELRARAERALELVGLRDQMHRGYSELSGGQRQRVLLARALALEPDLLALDEPTSALDPGTTERLLELIDHLRRQHGLTVVLVTHDLSLVAQRMTHMLALFEGRYVAGSVEETFTEERLSDLYRYPVTIMQSGRHKAVLLGSHGGL